MGLPATPTTARAQEREPLPKRLYSVEESARYLALSQWTVRDLVASGKLPAVRVGKRVLLDIRDLDEWIEREKTRAEPW